MRFFDLHCDTISECCGKKKELYDNEMSISICKGKCLDKWCELFAIWIPDDLRGQAAIDYFDENYKYFCTQMEKNSLYIKQCRTSTELKDTMESKKNAAILTVEGGSAAAGSLDRLDYLESLGVKAITLTWNGSNEIGHGSRSGCDDGLTPFGKSFVRRMEEKKMVVDVSHLNLKGFFDVARTIDAPFIASHSNCDAVRSYPRNLNDEQLKLLIERNGLCGINFCDYFLSEDKNNGLEAVCRHISHILALGGEKILSLGSDFDGCNINPEIDSIDKMPAMYDYLIFKGFGKKTVDALFFDNAYRFFSEQID